MLRVKASLSFRGQEKMPTDIVIDIPEEYCNRDKWDEFIGNILFSILQHRVKIDYELIEES